jgi:hypothetical protein
MRYLKIAGPTLLALAAMGAILSSAAQAKFDTIKTFPTQEHIFLKAEADPTEPNQVTATVTGGFTWTCTGFSLRATAADKATEFEGEPVYTGCSTPLGGMAIRSNGCTYKFTSETNVSEHAVAHLVCPTGKELEIETGGCVIFLAGGQTLSGVHYSNVQTGTAEKEMHLTVSITWEMNTHGHSSNSFACQLGGVPATFTEGSYKGKLTVKAVEDNAGVEGAATGATYETLTTETMP